MTNDVSSQILLAFLNDAWLRAPASANSLRELLEKDQSEVLQFVRKGSLASVGKNSANQSYENYGPGSLTQVQSVEILSNLISFYDQVKSKIKGEFVASADFDYTEPAGFDYDTPIYEVLTLVFTGQSAGSTFTLPDLRCLRTFRIDEVDP